VLIEILSFLSKKKKKKQRMLCVGSSLTKLVTLVFAKKKKKTFKVKIDEILLVIDYVTKIL
jgi:hypothetical protein